MKPQATTRRGGEGGEERGGEGRGGEGRGGERRRGEGKGEKEAMNVCIVLTSSSGA